MPLIMFLIFAIFIFLASYFPGRMILNYLPVDSEEKMVGAFGISFLLFYLFGFTSYIFSLERYLPFLLLSLTLVSFLIALLHRFLRKDEIIKLLFFCLIYIVFLSFQVLHPFYSGGGWVFDWYEHYTRSLFFLNHLPHFSYIGPYQLPDRPPLFHLVSYTFQTLLGSDFWIFQIMSTLTNILPILPLYLIVKSHLSHFKNNLLYFTSLSFIALLPSFSAHATFTWNKAITSYFILSGFYFYLKTYHEKKMINYIAASLLLGLGYLTHFSAGIFILFIFLDFFRRTIFTLKTMVAPFLLSLAILIITLSTYFIWAINIYGLDQAILGNTSYQWQKDLTLNQQLDKAFYNIKHGLLPLIPDFYSKELNSQSDQILQTYDRLYSLYVNNFWGAVSFSMSLLLFFIFFTRLTKWRHHKNLTFPSPKKLYIIFLFIAIYVLGNIVNPNRNGSTIPITLYALGLFFAILILRNIILIRNKIPKVVLLLSLVGLGVESLGFALLKITTLENRLYLPLTYNTIGFIHTSHQYNYYLKTHYHLIFLYDYLQNYHWVFLLIFFLGNISLFLILIRTLILNKSS